MTILSDQSISSRISKIKQDTNNKIKLSYPNGYLVKNETESNSIMTALSRSRSSGYIVPKKVAYRD